MLARSTANRPEVEGDAGAAPRRRAALMSGGAACDVPAAFPCSAFPAHVGEGTRPETQGGEEETQAGLQRSDESPRVAGHHLNGQEHELPRGGGVR